MRWDWGPNSENRHTSHGPTKFPFMERLSLVAMDGQMALMSFLLPGDTRPSKASVRNGEKENSLVGQQPAKRLPMILITEVGALANTAHTYTDLEGPIKARWPANLPSRGFVPIYRRRRQPRL